MHADRYRLEVQLDPSSHRLTGRATIDLVRADVEPVDPRRPAEFALEIHPDLRITGVRGAGAKVRSFRRLRIPKGLAPTAEDADSPPAVRKYVVAIARPSEAMTLFVTYDGPLFQDVAAGEKPGEIHNFLMRAHIGNDGIYLGDGSWYPRPARDGDSAPPPAHFTLLTDRVEGIELVAGGEKDSQLGEATGKIAWRSPFPLTEMVLVGGAHEVHRDQHRGVEIAVHLKPSQSEHAVGLIDSVKNNLDRYEPLIGTYPARQYTIVDNFFSSGFAFPCFTLLSSAVIDMGERSQRTHGYLDHEFLHSWWGNGVHVDPRDGNWCEALASYGANYYGFVLDDRESEARKKRRNYVHFLSRIKPESDKPLGTFGQKDGCSRSIAYDKGAMVFHMLARKMGQDSFWKAIQDFNRQFVGRYASWEDIRSVCEKNSGLDLTPFFRQWVRQSGAPVLAVEQARHNSSEGTVAVNVVQDRSDFDLEVPLRFNGPGGVEDVSVAFTGPAVERVVSVANPPHTVELDPDYHLFRRLDPASILPTTASTRSGSAITCVLPWGESADDYEPICDLFLSGFKVAERRTRSPKDLRPDADLAERCVLILGEAVRDPAVDAFLSAIEFPIRWTDGGFEFDDVEYNEPGDAVLCTVRHPGVSGGGVTIVYANSKEAIPSARLIPFYDQSMVIFQGGMPSVRQDFEPSQTLRVERY